MPIPKPPKFVNIAIMTTLTVIFWVFFSVYNILTTDVTPSTAPDILAPLNPSLNIQTLDTISNSIYFDDSQIVGLGSNDNNETITEEIESEEIDELEELDETLQDNILDEEEVEDEG